MVAAKIETLKHGGDRKSDQDANLHLDISRADAPHMLNISPRSVASAAKVLERGTPELIAAVNQGDMPVSAAAKSVASAFNAVKTKTKLSERGRNPERLQNMRMCNEIWSHLNAALAGLTNLPAATEVSRAAEFHHRALAEPDGRLPPHPAPIVRPRP